MIAVWLCYDKWLTIIVGIPPPKLLNLWYGILSVYPTVGLCQQRFTSLPSVGTREAMIGYCRQ